MFSLWKHPYLDDTVDGPAKSCTTKRMFETLMGCLPSTGAGFRNHPQYQPLFITIKILPFNNFLEITNYNSIEISYLPMFVLFHSI